MRKSMIAAAAAFIMVISCACQATPEKSIVTSKNDGTFEAALENTPVPTADDAPAETSAAETYTDSFENANGNIRYELTLTAPSVQTALPVIQVRPMEITPELAKRTAQAVFGDTEFYQYSSRHTKAELEQLILDLRQRIADWDALVDQCGGKEDEAALLQQMLEDELASAESLYDQAPETLERVACDWQFHPLGYYSDSLYGEDDYGYQSIKASATVGGIPFVFNASNLERDDFRVHSISVEADSDLTDTSAIYADGEESANSEAARARAVQIADAMGLGQWRAVSADEAAAGYNGTVTLTRLYDGLPLTRHDSPSERETAYGPPYQYEELQIAFHGDAVVYFFYTGALEKVSTVNENVQTLPFDEVLAAAKTRMQLWGTVNPVTGETISAAADGSFTKIAVNSVQLGLTRVLIKNDTTDYYLVPTYTFYGVSTDYNADGIPVDHSFFDETTGQTITLPNENTVELAVINAVDGSAIDTGPGY